MTFIEQAQREVTDDASRNLFEQLSSKTRSYGETFGRVAELQHQRDRHVAVMDELGPKITAALEEVVRAEATVAPSSLADRAFLFEQVVLMRFEGYKYLLNNAEANLNKALAENRDAIDLLARVGTGLRADAAAKIREDLDAYRQGIEAVASVILKRNELIAGTLDTIGPEVAELIEGAKLDAANGATSAIAAAMEQQTTTTAMISRSTHEAATGTESVTRNIHRLHETSQQTAQCSESIHQAADDLARQAETLRGAVRSFLGEVRAA